MLLFLSLLASLGVSLIKLDIVSSDYVPYACYGRYSDYDWCNTSLSLDERLDSLVSSLTLEEKAAQLTARQSPLNFVPRLGIPEYDWGANCVYAVKSNCGTKCPSTFPMPPGLAASFNLTLIRDVASIIGRELRSLYLQGVGEAHTSNLPHIGLDCWSPTINIARDPRWGRNYEVPGEDPLLNGLYGMYHTLGLQNGSTTYNKEYYDPRYYQGIVTLKHFDAYSLESFNGTTRHNFNAVVSPYSLNDTYLPAFERSIVDGGAKGVMCSYNSVNGVPSCANSYLINDVMRKLWGYDGYVTSDSGAITDISNNHHYVSTIQDAVAVAINATCDMDSYLGNGYGMESDWGTGSPYQEYISELINSSKVLESTLDSSIKRLFKLRFELGLFDPIDDQPYWKVPPSIVNNDESQELNKFASKQSIILLKNDKTNNSTILPWNITTFMNRTNTISVIGPHYNATSGLILSGYTPPVCMDESYDCMSSILNELSNRIGKNNVLSSQGCDVQCENQNGFADAISVAQKSDYIVLMMGIDTSHIEGEGRDRYNITLPGYQTNLASEICKISGKQVILVLINGGMIAIDELNNECDAIIEAHYPGFYGSEAIWDVIFGDYNPSGKTVMTMYYSNFTKISSMYEMNMNVAPGKSYKYFTKSVLYPFGYGLSYTSFKLSIDSYSIIINKIRESTSWVFELTLGNTGDMDGCETVMIYMKPLEIPSSQNASNLIKQLIGFRKYELKSMETIPFQYNVTKNDLYLVNNEGIKTLFNGKYDIVFTNGVDQTVSKTVTLNVTSH